MHERLLQSPTRQYSLPAAVARILFCSYVLVISLLVSTSPALAIPPPPAKPPLLRNAKMTEKVQLIEAANGQVFRITEICKVSGIIPVYADEGRAASTHGTEIRGCSMPRNGEKLPVSIRGAKAVTKNAGTFARAYASVVPPDAVPACPDVCGLRPLADSGAEIQVTGFPKLLKFNLSVNPGSVRLAKPTVWLDAQVQIVD